MHRTQIYLPDESYHSLRDESRRSGLTLAELVRRAVDRYLDQEKTQNLQDALSSSFGTWGEMIESTEEITGSLRQDWIQRDLRCRLEHTD